MNRNLKDASRKEKLLQKWSAHPYTITGIRECGNVYVKDIWGKGYKRSLPPKQLKPYKDANYISSDEDVEQNNMEEISAINSFCHKNFLLSRVSITNDEGDVSCKCKQSKIDLNMPIDKIDIEVLDEIEESHIQTTINESWPDEPSPEFQDLTTQNVDPKDPELLITGFIAASSWISSFKLYAKEKNFNQSHQAGFQHQSTRSAVC